MVGRKSGPDYERMTEHQVCKILGERFWPAGRIISTLRGAIIKTSGNFAQELTLLPEEAEFIFSALAIKNIKEAREKWHLVYDLGFSLCDMRAVAKAGDILSGNKNKQWPYLELPWALKRRKPAYRLIKPEYSFLSKSWNEQEYKIKKKGKGVCRCSTVLAIYIQVVWHLLNEKFINNGIYSHWGPEVGHINSVKEISVACLSRVSRFKGVSLYFWDARYSVEDAGVLLMREISA